MTGLFKNWSKRREEKRKAKNRPKFVQAKPLEYHPKIILAWAKVIEGNEEIEVYLEDNGFEELIQATKAIREDYNARNWLMENGYPHLLAMINAAEGNKQALQWLLQNKMQLFYKMSIAIQGDPMGFKWLKDNSSEEIFFLTRIIKETKEKLAEE